MAGMTIGETGYIMAYDSDGKLIYHPDNSRIFTRIGESGYTDALKNAVLEQQDVVGLVYKEGSHTFHGTTLHVPMNDWQIVGCMPHPEYMYEITRFAGTILLCFLAIAVLLTVVALVNVRCMVKPIRKLVEVSDRLTQGDVEEDTGGNDEIGDLARSRWPPGPRPWPRGPRSSRRRWRSWLDPSGA